MQLKVADSKKIIIARPSQRDPAEAETLQIGAVVAAVHSPASLALARKMRRGEVDFLELRVDAFAALGADQTHLLLRAASRLSLPLIVTVRHFREGGAARLDARQRRDLFEQFLPHAALIDVELRSAKELASVLKSARERGAKIILSHHDFQKTPSREKLGQLANEARSAGADIFKIAAKAANPRELAVLFDFLASEAGEKKSRSAGSVFAPALSVMAMGEFGKISRLLFAKTGSVLNYGFLDKANASGQWPAKLLKKRIAEV